MVGKRRFCRLVIAAYPCSRAHHYGVEKEADFSFHCLSDSALMHIILIHSSTSKFPRTLCTLAQAHLATVLYICHIYITYILHVTYMYSVHAIFRFTVTSSSRLSTFTGMNNFGDVAKLCDCKRGSAVVQPLLKF